MFVSLFDHVAVSQRLDGMDVGNVRPALVRPGSSRSGDKNNVNLVALSG